MSGCVALVGAGPGDPGLLTVKAARLIAEADVLVYDALVSAPIVALAGETCEMIYVGKRARNHTMPQGEISALLVERARAGLRVVRLKGGDPLVFGRGGEEAQELHTAGVSFEIVPGISSALAAPAYAGIPVTHRDYNTSFTVATGHEDPAKTASTVDWARLADGHGMAIFLMAMSNLPYVVDRLTRHGLSTATPVAVIRDGTTPRQVTLTATLATVVDAVAEAAIGAPAIVAVGTGVALRDEIRWFDNHGLFGKRVLVTRPHNEADELVRGLWECGAEPVLVPSIAYAPAPDDAAVQAAVAALAAATYAWIVLSSRRGVVTLFDALHAAGLDARALGSVRIAAVGAQTAAALELGGLRADLVPEIFQAVAVADALTRRLAGTPGARVLAWGAQDGTETLPIALREAGHSVDRAAAYAVRQTLSPELAEAAAASDIWTFASASAVDGFLAAVSGAHALAEDRAIACLGPVTAGAARERGLRVDATASHATTAALLAALKALPRQDTAAA